LKQEDFFESAGWQAEPPLAERMRPSTADEFVGQQQVMAPEKLIGRLLRHGRLQSLILWGPPGCGKTTLARLIARDTEAHLINLSAVTAGVKDVRAAVDEARQQQSMRRKRTILFVDEIHRFNKAQQDLLLPHVESGTITFIGATTENPSFEVISPLLSRAPVVVLEPLRDDDLEVILKSALEDKERGVGRLNADIDEDALAHLIRAARGDARLALNGLEVAVLTTSPNPSGRRHLNLQTVVDAVQKKAFIYDKDGEEHYNLISALHKSLRGSDPDAAALVVTIAAQQAFHFLGRPEGDLALAEAAVYLATAPKSNSLYKAYGRAKQEAKDKGNLPVPLPLRNAPTGLMHQLGYGRGYCYPHDYSEAHVPMSYLPEDLQDLRFYEPTNRGFEATVGERLNYWRRRVRQERSKQQEEGSRQ
jgi:putative ATPase